MMTTCAEDARGALRPSGQCTTLAVRGVALENGIRVVDRQAQTGVSLGTRSAHPYQPACPRSVHASFEPANGPSESRRLAGLLAALAGPVPAASALTEVPQVVIQDVDSQFQLRGCHHGSGAAGTGLVDATGR